MTQHCLLFGCGSLGLVSVGRANPSTRVHNDHFNNVLCVPSIYCNLLSVYHITHSCEGKKIEFSPHQVLIKDLKDPKHVLTT
jgi:hypothetical protein